MAGKKQSLRELYEESRYETDGDETAGVHVDRNVHRIIVTLVALAATLAIYASMPLTHAGAKVRYNGMQMADAAMHKHMIREVRDNTVTTLAMDFTRIVTPAEQETSEIMRYVAKECLPETVAPYVMPGWTAIRVYGEATDYLVCVMKTQPHRFCHPAERARLVEQLLAYRDRRQNIIAIEGRRKAMLKNPRIQQQLAIMRSLQVIGDGSGTSATPPPEPVFVGDVIDPKLMDGLAHLVRNGLVSRADFGYMGLYLPEEYVSALMTEKTAATCGY